MAESKYQSMVQGTVPRNQEGSHTSTELFKSRINAWDIHKMKKDKKKSVRQCSEIKKMVMENRHRRMEIAITAGNF